MKMLRQIGISTIGVHLCSWAVLLCATGCLGKPDKANIELRKTIQGLENQIQELNRRHETDVATIQALEQRGGTVATLPRQRLDELFTVHGVQIGRLSGGIDRDRDRPGDERLKVYVVPTDQHGDPIKAAGSFTIEAFDLSLGEQNRVARWEFSTEDARKQWFGKLLSYTYAFEGDWERPPAQKDLNIRVSFTDALTGRTFTDQRVVKVRPPTKEQ